MAQEQPWTSELTRDQMYDLRIRLQRAGSDIVRQYGDDQPGVYEDVYDARMDLADEWGLRGLLDVEL